MSKMLTKEELIDKIEWVEGGISEAIQYGIESKDIKDRDISKLWEEASDLYCQYELIVIKIEDLLYEE